MKVSSVMLALVVWIAGTSPSHGQRYQPPIQHPNTFPNRVSSPYYKPGIKNLSRVGGVYGLLSQGLPSNVVRSSSAGYTPQRYPSPSNSNPYQVYVNQNTARRLSQPRNYIPVRPNRYQSHGNFLRRTPINNFRSVSNVPHLALLLAAKARIDGNRNDQSRYHPNTGYPVYQAQQPNYLAQHGYHQQPTFPAHIQQTYVAQPAHQPTYPTQHGYPQQPAYPTRLQQEYAVQPQQRPNQQPEYPIVANPQTGNRRLQPARSQNSYHQGQPSYSPNQSYQPQQSEYPLAAKSQPGVYRGQLPHSDQCFNTYMDQLKSYGFGFDKLGYPGDLIEKEMTTRGISALQLFTPGSRTHQTYPSADPHGMCFADRKILTKISHNGGICYLVQPDTQNIQVYMCRSRDFPYAGPQQGIHKCEEKYGSREVTAFCDGTGTGNKILKLTVKLPVGCGPKIYSC